MALMSTQMPISTRPEEELIPSKNSDKYLGPIIVYMKTGQLPEDSQMGCKIMLQTEDFFLVDDTLYHLYCSAGKGLAGREKLYI